MTAPMSLDPYVKRMRDAESDCERAAVLLEVPVFTLMRLADLFKHHCRRAAFDEGFDYVDLVRAELAKPRHRGGFVSAMNNAGAANTRLLGVLERVAA